MDKAQSNMFGKISYLNVLYLFQYNRLSNTNLVGTDAGGKSEFLVFSEPNCIKTF